MPVHVLQRERKVGHAERRLAVELGREPTEREIAKAAKVPIKQVRELKQSARTVTSLDRAVDPDDDTSFGELVAAEGPRPEDEVEVSLREEALRKAVSELPEPQQKVVKLRYGLNGEPDPKSVEEVTRQLGISRDQARKIEEEALARLGRMRELQGLEAAA